MATKFKNLLVNEFIFLIGSATLILLGVVIYGILFDVWYKDAYNIALVSLVIYISSIFIRGLAWLSKKIRK